MLAILHYYIITTKRCSILKMDEVVKTSDLDSKKSNNFGY